MLCANVQCNINNVQCLLKQKPSGKQIYSKIQFFTPTSLVSKTYLNNNELKQQINKPIKK